MTELTDAQLERQDEVDNAIWGMVQKLAGTELPWDIEAISDVRDLVQDIVHSHTGVEYNDFYPYLDQDEWDKLIHSDEDRFDDYLYTGSRIP